MSQVFTTAGRESVRVRCGRILVPLAASATALAIALGGTAVAHADDLSERRGEVKADIQDARQEITSSTAALERATATFDAANKQLEEAQAALDQTRKDLDAAKARNTELGAKLQAEQERLRAAQAATAEARARAEAQRAVLAEAARDAYRNRSDLSGLTVVLGSRSTAEFSQRLQWDTTIFSVTNDQFLRLRAVENELATAERAQAEAEKKVAAEKKTAEEGLAQTAQLERDAADRQAIVEGLTQRAEKLRAEAATALEEDTKQYNQLLAEDEAISSELSKRANEALSAAGSAPAASSGTVSGPTNSLGFIRPVDAQPGSPFGQRFHPILKIWRMHRGTDFGASCGAPLVAARAGTVVSARPQGGFGNYVVIDHGVVGGSSIMTGYAHMQSMSVSAGQRVEQGQSIGTVGTTGLSTGCHLHLQVYKNGGVVDPMSMIP